MIALLRFILAFLAAPFKSKSRLEAENAALRHQLIVLRRKVHGRVGFTNNDRWFFIQLYGWFPPILQVRSIIKPETLVRWHRASFRCYWRWKSRPVCTGNLRVSTFPVASTLAKSCHLSPRVTLSSRLRRDGPARHASSCNALAQIQSARMSRKT